MLQDQVPSVDDKNIGMRFKCNNIVTFTLSHYHRLVEANSCFVSLKTTCVYTTLYCPSFISTLALQRCT